MTDLVEKIAWAKCEALNKTRATSLENVLKQGLRDQEAMLLESDADEQLLITIVFSSRVKLHSLALGAPTDGRAPKEVSLFTNPPSMDFSDAEGRTPTQKLEFTADTLGVRQELKFVNFQNVDSVALFVASNQGDEETSALSSLQFWGTGVGTTNMSEFKRVAGEKGEGE